MARLDAGIVPDCNLVRHGRPDLFGGDPLMATERPQPGPDRRVRRPGLARVPIRPEALGVVLERDFMI